MSLKLSVYVGPYLELPKDFDWEPFELVVTEGCGEGYDGEKLVLIPNADLPRCSREFQFDTQSGIQGVSPISFKDVQQEIEAFKKLVIELLLFCRGKGIESSVYWGVVPGWF